MNAFICATFKSNDALLQNVVMGANAHCAIEKFARYWDVEARMVPVSEESNYCLDPKKAMQYVDENTIGVCEPLIA